MRTHPHPPAHARPPAYRVTHRQSAHLPTPPTHLKTRSALSLRVPPFVPVLSNEGNFVVSLSKLTRCALRCCAAVVLLIVVPSTVVQMLCPRLLMHLRSDGARLRGGFSAAACVVFR